MPAHPVQLAGAEGRGWAVKRQMIIVSAVGAALACSTLAGASSNHGGDRNSTDQCSTEATVEDSCVTAIAAAMGAATSPDVITTSGASDQISPLGRVAPTPTSDATTGLPAADTTATTELTASVVSVARPSAVRQAATATTAALVTTPAIAGAPVTAALVTAAPVTTSPVATPPVTDPAVTAAPVTPAPVTDPPVTDPAVTDPPVTDPPVTDPPVTQPPVVDPSFTMSTSTPRVGESVTFDASATRCPAGVACSYTWEWSWRSADGTRSVVGGQMGRTPTITYAFDAFAASKSSVTVLLSVGQGRVHPVQRVQRTFTVVGA